LSIDFKEVPYGSPEYRASLELRYRILRLPLGLQFSREDLEREVTDHHLVCIMDGEVTGIILMRPLDEFIIKMRQVAIDEDLQRKGIGTALVEYAEAFAREHGYHRIEMHARKEAVPFYEKMEYAVEGDEFFEVGIPHYKMFREI
jgi:N-acetylglutamate synthase-like GNAT family acetyltransferase